MVVLDTSHGSNLWYVVHCKAKKEFYAADILSNQLGLRIYLPKTEICIQQETRQAPFFPGYFFIQANLQKVGLSQINSSPGVLKLLDFGDGPLVVSQALVELMQEEINRYNTYTHRVPQNLSLGDEVRITAGPLKGLKAVFTDRATSGDRVQVLLHFLGRLSNVQLDLFSVEKLADKPARRERQTRGEGRRIKKAKELSLHENAVALHPRMYESYAETPPPSTR